MVVTDLCGGTGGSAGSGLFGWCCCDACCVIRDDFDGSALSASWTTSDTWTVTGGYASPTAANDEALHNYEHSSANLVVDMHVYASADTEFFVYFDDGSKYLKVVTDAADVGGYLVYGTSGGGDDTTLRATINNGTEYIVRYCYDGTTMVGNVLNTAGETLAAISKTLSYSGEQVGMGVGTYSGTPQIRGFYASDYDASGCVTCGEPLGCTTCEGNFGPNYIELVIAGFSGSYCSTALCENFNGTYLFEIFPNVNPCAKSQVIQANWPVTDGPSPAPCVGSTDGGGGGYLVEVAWLVQQAFLPPFDFLTSDYIYARCTSFSPTSFCGEDFYFTALGSITNVSSGKFPCFSVINDLEVSYYGGWNGTRFFSNCTGGTGLCDTSSATATFTAFLEA